MNLEAFALYKDKLWDNKINENAIYKLLFDLSCN